MKFRHFTGYKEVSLLCRRGEENKLNNFAPLLQLSQLADACFPALWANNTQLLQICIGSSPCLHPANSLWLWFFKTLC